MKKILVAVDGSAESKKAAAQAVLLAGKFGAEVTLLTVVEVENDVAYTEFGIVSGEYTGVRDTLVRIRTENSGKMLDAIIAGLDCTGIPVKSSSSVQRIRRSQRKPRAANTT